MNPQEVKRLVLALIIAMGLCVCLTAQNKDAAKGIIAPAAKNKEIHAEHVHELQEVVVSALRIRHPTSAGSFPAGISLPVRA